MSDPVPAITEAAATGEVAATFADIREIMGVGVVNLIWRHLATIEGALPWAWGTLRPLYADGSVEQRADSLRGALVLPAVPAPVAEVFVGLGLDREALHGIRAVLDAYDHTNGMAIVALSALRAVIAGHEVSGAPLPLLPRRARPAIPLPPLPTMDALAPPTAALVRELNGFGARRPQPVLASMYRHLAYWPSYLSFAWLVVAPLEADGRLAGAIDEAGPVVTQHAESLLPAMGHAAAGLSPRLAEAVAAALDPFIGDVILKMLVICGLLRRLTQPSDRKE